MTGSAAEGCVLAFRVCTRTLQYAATVNECICSGFGLPSRLSIDRSSADSGFTVPHFHFQRQFRQQRRTRAAAARRPFCVQCQHIRPSSSRGPSPRLTSPRMSWTPSVPDAAQPAMPACLTAVLVTSLLVRIFRLYVFPQIPPARIDAATML